MNKLIIVSNRLPVSIEKKEETILITPSVGGLATGMKSVYKQYDSLWIGWSGIDKDELSDTQEKHVLSRLKKEKCFPVYLEQDDIELYYEGFSNRTIWPLFHYFPQYTEYNPECWQSYKKVNMLFAEAILQNMKGDEMVWIHDYHLLLVPQLIKEVYPDALIGFFLHIPFPSYEIFRILPWRKEIIHGMLGADLLGFHVFDYGRHFLSTVRRLMGFDVSFNLIHMSDRVSKVETFPMGIDYAHFNKTAKKLSQRKEDERSFFKQEIERLKEHNPDRKLILSIDRLDYSKGIPNRLLAYEHFLEKYPEFHGKVTLIMLSVPSRSNVPQYQLMKKEVDELVGRINGRFGIINWTPIWYFYRSMPFENLVELYNSSDIALITPIRDGMNLVAKEYIACKTNRLGVLILSEMAGAAKEMSEAIIINPNNTEEMADAIEIALTMPAEEQLERNIILQERLKRYNVEKWAGDFVDNLVDLSHLKTRYLANKLTPEHRKNLISDYQKASRRLLLLDYNGTLTSYGKTHQKAIPDNELLEMLDNIVKDKNTDLYLITGWEKKIFDNWFKGKKYGLITEHGSIIKEPGKAWSFFASLNTSWKELVKPILQLYVDRTPGASIYEKHFSLVWDYRKADPELGPMRALEIKDELNVVSTNQDFEILDGDKLIEVKSRGVNKGAAALKIIEKNNYDFILAAGDDWSDEFLFGQLPKDAWTLRIGISKTIARYNLNSYKDMRTLLTELKNSYPGK